MKKPVKTTNPLLAEKAKDGGVCPRCGSAKTFWIAFGTWFHCWSCRLVCTKKELQIEKNKPVEVKA